MRYNIKIGNLEKLSVWVETDEQVFVWLDAMKDALVAGNFSVEVTEDREIVRAPKAGA